MASSLRVCVCVYFVSICGMAVGIWGRCPWEACRSRNEEVSCLQCLSSIPWGCPDACVVCYCACLSHCTGRCMPVLCLSACAALLVVWNIGPLHRQCQQRFIAQPAALVVTHFWLPSFCWPCSERCREQSMGCLSPLHSGLLWPQVASLVGRRHDCCAVCVECTAVHTYVCVSLWSEQRSMADACCVSVRLSEWQGQ